MADSSFRALRFNFPIVLFLALFAWTGRAACGDQFEEFSWRQCAGQSIRVMFDQHPYAEGIKRKLTDFERLTGIRVAFIMYPEETYFSRLDQALERGILSPDVYMTGVYQVWKYAYEGKMTPLDDFINNPSKTRSLYNVGDFFPPIIGAFRWNRRFGYSLGYGQLWALPIGFETAALTYNREVMAKHRLAPPRSMEQLLAVGKHLNQFEGQGTYGVAARGAGVWNSLHSGYITAFANYGAEDIVVENGKLVSKVNSPEAVAITDMWIRMLTECGPWDWENYTWYRCLEDLESRKAAMLYDADILGYNANVPGASAQAGKLGMVPPPAPEGTLPNSIKSNLWAWGLAINPDSDHRDAAWLFVQYFTNREFQLFSVVDWTSVNPPRRSVFEDPAFRVKIASMEGYVETMNSIVQNASIYFTPNPYFFDISERWAAIIRDIANGMYSSTQE
ncbi:MAG: extracellular solute-binding protein, partial [Planctomycetes bacterium]|nr:extracellular solute-binding protein [Planctomycetota bacterium]